jgi:hypothetical protein
VVVALQAITQAGKLIPVRFQPDAEQTYPVFLIYGTERFQVDHDN